MIAGSERVAAVPFRGSDTPPAVPVSGAVAAICALVAVVLGGCAGLTTLGPSVAAWLAIAAAVAGMLALVALAVFGACAFRYYGWRFFGLPPRHTVKNQFLRALSDLGYIPPDMTKWHSRNVKVELDYRTLVAAVKFTGGMMKPLFVLSADLHHNGYMRHAYEVNVEPLDELTPNAGFVATIDYLHPKKRNAWIAVTFDEK